MAKISAVLIRYDEKTGEEVEIPVVAEYEYEPGAHSTWGSDGGDPGWPPSIEVHDVKASGTGEVFEPTDEEYRELELASWEEMR